MHWPVLLNHDLLDPAPVDQVSAQAPARWQATRVTHSPKQNTRATRRTLPPAALLLLLLAALLAVLAHAWQRGRPVALPEVGTQQLPCVSYAPFRRDGHTPFDANLRVTPAQIEEDLRLLKTLTGCVRTYGLDHGLDAVPTIARQLGMRVVLGAWIGRDTAANQQQLTRALALCREHADVIDLLVVGNEVLLRRELTPEALAALLAQARQGTKVTIAYADVWEFWQRHASVLRPHVDVVAAHVLPFWEDEPVAVEDAVAHVRSIATRLAASMAPTPVFIAETGWPSEGRQRAGAIPGTLAQAQFVRELLASTQAQPLPLRTGRLPPFNVIEGFDQPWKRALEGAMGGYWGLFTADGQQRVMLAGKVVADPAWWHAYVGAAMGAGVGVLWATLAHGQRRLRPRAGSMLLLGCALLGALVPQQWQWQRVWGQTAWDDGLGAALLAVALLVGLLTTWRLAVRFNVSQHTPAPDTRPGVVDAWRAGTHATVGQPAWRWLATLQAVLLFACVCMALGLLFDARYRPLTWPLLAAPACLALLLAASGERLNPAAHEERLLAWCLALAAPLLVSSEGLQNKQALGLAALWLALAAATLWRHGAASSFTAVARGRANTKAANTTAGAAKPAE